MPAILELPQELWQIILGQLERKSIKALNQTCWILHAHTLPTLYVDIAAPSRFKNDKHISRWIGSVLLALLNRPSLGKSVKSIDLTFPRFSEYLYSSAPSCTWQQDVIRRWEIGHREVASDYAAGRSELFPDSTSIAEAVKDGNPDALVAVVISLLPNLGALSVAGAFISSSSQYVAPLLARVGDLWRIKKEAPLLARLEAFEVNERRDTEGFWPSWDAMKALFYLPRLKSLSAILPNPWDWNWPDGVAPISQLTRLHLLASTIRPSKLSQMLVACPKLEVFHLEAAILVAEPMYTEAHTIDKHRNWFDMYGTAKKPHPDWVFRGDPNPYILNLSRLTEALLPYQSTLKELALRALPVLPTKLQQLERVRSVPVDSGGMCNLHRFSNLQVLDVSADMLFTPGDADSMYKFFKTIPPNLRKLYWGVWNHAQAPTARDQDKVIKLLRLLVNYNIYPPGCELAMVDDGQDDRSQPRIASTIAFCRQHSIPYSLNMEDEGARLMDREAMGVWTAGWHPNIRGVEGLEKYWRKGLRTLYRNDVHAPLWLRTYADTLTESMLAELSEDE